MSRALFQTLLITLLAISIYKLHMYAPEEPNPDESPNQSSSYYNRQCVEKRYETGAIEKVRTCVWGRKE